MSEQQRLQDQQQDLDNLDNLDHLDHPVVKCDRCGQAYGIGEYPFCPHGLQGGGPVHDEIPGGMWLENYGPVPIKVYSHTERRKIMAERGLQERETFAPFPGTDKDPQGIPNPKGFMDPKTLENAKTLILRQQGVKAEDLMDDSEPYASAIEPFNSVGDEVSARMTIGAIDTFEREGGNRDKND